jgi:hypothetical protein
VIRTWANVWLRNASFGITSGPTIHQHIPDSLTHHILLASINIAWLWIQIKNFTSIRIRIQARHIFSTKNLNNKKSKRHFVFKNLLFLILQWFKVNANSHGWTKRALSFKMKVNGFVYVLRQWGLGLKGQSHEKIGEIRPWDGSLRPN